MEAVITYGKFDYSCRNRSEVIVFGPFFLQLYNCKNAAFYKKYICKKAAFLQDRFLHHICMYVCMFVCMKITEFASISRPWN